MRGNWICTLAVCFLIFGFSSCSSLTEKLLKDPEVKVIDVKVTDISAKDLSLDLKLNINNPNARSFNIGKIVYGLSLSGDQVTEGVYDKGIEVPAEGATDVVVPLKFKYSSLQTLVSNLLKKSLTKDYELTGTVDVGIFSIPFKQKGTLELGK